MTAARAGPMKAPDSVKMRKRPTKRARCSGSAGARSAPRVETIPT
eukprot:CAMPEP_0183349470 /NCGR_PEP_ID=MMETSP0164_2-20130417/13640_1 /TAXON_ID=221442 /ORGANISM="Coccolithus pelagicus ssp braarudi, Strain PLY182g" /LENGTH=44 /DNA_ID= /DNA_START= /DNA_END= /DNA_ORIENTATION=